MIQRNCCFQIGAIKNTVLHLCSFSNDNQRSSTLYYGSFSVTALYIEERIYINTNIMQNGYNSFIELVN